MRASKTLLTALIIGVLLVSWAAPHFGIVEHAHKGGERPHLHLHLSLANGSTPYPHVHGDLDLHPFPGPVDVPLLTSDLEPSLTHWHQFDDSIPTLAFSLSPISPILAFTFLKSLPLIPKQHPPVITKGSRAPPLPRTLA